MFDPTDGAITRASNEYKIGTPDLYAVHTLSDDRRVGRVTCRRETESREAGVSYIYPTRDISPRSPYIRTVLNSVRPVLWTIACSGHRSATVLSRRRRRRAASHAWWFPDGGLIVAANVDRNWCLRWLEGRSRIVRLSFVLRYWSRRRVTTSDHRRQSERM